MTAHTLGPWTLEFDSCGDIDPNCKGGYEVEGPERDVHGYRLEADANLIAAAPDLLAAAKRVAEDFDKQMRGGRAVDYMKHWAELSAAIVKAEGR